MVGRLIGIWQTANKRGTKRREEEAEQQIGDIPRRLTDERHMELIHGYKEAHRELKLERDVPAKVTIETNRTMVEQKGAYIAVPLSEVASKEEAPDRAIHDAHLKSDGSIKIVSHSVVTVPLPVDPEELCYGITLYGCGWEFTRLEFPNRTARLGLGADDWSEHVE